jgi:hypothetical protein
MAEEQLDGGIANAGQVVRAGQHVLRPSSRHSASIHAFLQALRQAGFDGAPSPVGIDADGRERLVFIAGDVPRVPYPAWCQSAEALASVARLLRRFHDTALRFDASRFAWNGALADPAGGTIVCHNDLEPSNVVFDDGVAVAMLDFEFAAPGRAVYDSPFSPGCGFRSTTTSTEIVWAGSWMTSPLDFDWSRTRMGSATENGSG